MCMHTERVLLQKCYLKGYMPKTMSLCFFSDTAAEAVQGRATGTYVHFAIFHIVRTRINLDTALSSMLNLCIMSVGMCVA